MLDIYIFMHTLVGDSIIPVCRTPNGFLKCSSGLQSIILKKLLQIHSKTFETAVWVCGMSLRLGEMIYNSFIHCPSSYHCSNENAQTTRPNRIL